MVKTAFNQRRKTINNSLKGLIGNHVPNEILKKRPEQLSVQEFVLLTKWIEEQHHVNKQG